MSRSSIFYNVDEWIENNSHYFEPPVCNRVMHNDQLKVFYVGGPNIRADFHLEEGEELFYMVKGNMCLKVYANNKFQNIIINEGDIFLLPARILHSPQRQDDTIGLVIERERLTTEKDCLRYYVDGSDEVLFERWFHCVDLGSQLVPIIQEFFASEQYRTGKPISGSLNPNPPYQFDNKRTLERPIQLKDWLHNNRSEIHERGWKSLYRGYETDVIIYGKGKHSRDVVSGDTFLWQLDGTSNVHLPTKVQVLQKINDSLLIPSGTKYTIDVQSESLLMAIIMNADSIQKTKFNHNERNEY